MLNVKLRPHLWLIPAIVMAVFAVSGCSANEPTETTPDSSAAEMTIQSTPAPQISETEPQNTENSTEITSETTTEIPPEEPEDDHIITIDGIDYFVTSKYNTTAIGCYDEDNFLERFSSSYLDVDIVPGQTVIGGSTVYDNGTQVYITARDGSWTYGPATVRNHYTGYGNSTLQLYFGSEEELAEFESVNLSGCTVHEITTPNYAQPKTMEIGGEEYYVLETISGKINSIDDSPIEPERPDLPNYGIYADPEVIPQGSIVYIESAGTTDWSFGPITTIVPMPNMGNKITIKISDSAEHYKFSHTTLYDTDNCTIRIISAEKPETETVPEQTRVSTYEFTTDSPVLPEEPPEYDDYAEIFFPPCASPEDYGYNGYGITDLTFSYLLYEEKTEQLAALFGEEALTPADSKDPDFTPDFYIDFNNGFVVAVSAESSYCEAAYYKILGNASFRNHLFNESFVDALETRGKPYTVSDEAMEMIAEIIEQASFDPEDFSEVPEFELPESNVLPIELDENWSSVSSVTLAYPLYPGIYVREDYPVRNRLGDSCVTYTITDPEIVKQLIYCLHPDNMKPNVSTYRGYPQATLRFDNGYMVMFYIQYEYDFISPCCYIGAQTYSMSLEAEQYVSEMFMTIE